MTCFARQFAHPIRIALIGVILTVTGCYSGHLSLSAAVQPIYEEGLAYYRASDYSLAERQFRKALERDNGAILIRYWLGMALVQQRNNDEATRHFHRLRVAAPKQPYGYYGLGLTALGAKNRRFDAVAWFREALRHDPTFVDAQWQLALTRLALTNGLFGAFSMGQVRQEFRRVITLDDKHPEAYYTLGTTYYRYGELDDAAQGLPLFEQQLVANPSHADARYQLGLAYIDMERIQEGIATLEGIKNLDPSRTETVNRAIVEAKLRNSLVRGDTVFQVIRLLPEQERGLYYDLSHVLAPGQKGIATEGAIDAMEQEAFVYWKQNNPSPESEDNVRLVEHCRRVAYSRRYFGRGMWPWDRRGEIYIRYGAPASMSTFVSDDTGASPSGSSGPVVQLGIRQVQRWVYETPPIQFDFVDQGSNYIFDAPLSVASGDISTVAREALNDQNAQMDDAAARMPSVYTDQIESGVPLPFSYSLTVFRGADGKPELEVDYAVPAAELMFKDQVATMETALTVYDDGWREQIKAVEQKRISSSTGDKARKFQVALYRRTLSLSPGEHQIALHLTDTESRRTGVSRRPLTVDTFEAGHLGMSDIQLVSQVAPSTEGAFVRGGRRLTPNPTGVFSRRKGAMLYFEVYNLQQNAAGRTQARIEYTIYPLSGSGRPIITAVGADVASADSERTFSLFQEEEGTQESLFRDIAIDLSRVSPGRYAIQVTVTDVNRTESVDKTVVFRLVE